jgi:hypothetical protein
MLAGAQPPRPLRAPSCCFATSLAVIAALTLAATLIADATLSAVVAAMIAARLADFVAGYGGRVTDKVVGKANALVDNKSNAVTNALGITRNAGNAANPFTCPSECFNAARLPFLGSSACICGDDLRTLQHGMDHTFNQALVSTVGAALLAASLTVLYGIIASDTARAFMLRRFMVGETAACDVEVGQTQGAPLRSALRLTLDGVPRKKLRFQEENHTACEAVVEMAPGPSGAGARVRHHRALSA